jgi:hypothetical protein
MLQLITTINIFFFTTDKEINKNYNNIKID